MRISKIENFVLQTQIADLIIALKTWKLSVKPVNVKALGMLVLHKRIRTSEVIPIIIVQNRR